MTGVAFVVAGSRSGRRRFGNGASASPRFRSAWLRDHPALSKIELLDDLRLLLEDGRHIQGEDVYRYLMRRVWWAWPLYLFSIAPVTKSLFGWGYRTIAKNRYRFSKA